MRSAHYRAMETAAGGLVVACGGDGTVHDCLQGVMRAGAASPRIAIWPVGTGNDIDRGLRLTKNRTLKEPTTAGGAPVLLQIAKGTNRLLDTG